MHLPFSTEQLATKKSVEGRRNLKLKDPFVMQLATQNPSQNLPSRSRDTRKHPKACPLKWSSHGFICWLTGLLVVAISIYDYISRIAMAAFLTSTARAFQGSGLVPVAVAILACASVVLPSIALGVCCGCHLSSTGSWAGRRTAAVVHLFAGSNGTASQEAVQRTRLLFSELLALNVFNRLRSWILPSGRVTAVRLAVAGCVLPPAALACCSLLWAQLTVVVAVATLAVAAMWACNAVGVIVIKILLVHRRGLLRYLDCLTHASALQLISSDCGAQHDCHHCTSTPTLPTNDAEAQRVAGAHPGCQQLQSGEAGPFLSLGSSGSPRPGQGLRPIGEEAAEWDSVSVACEEGECDDKPVGSLEDAALSAQRAGDLNCEHGACCGWQLPMRAPAFYTSATFAGSVPRQLHPCRSLKGAIRLHRQHLEACRDGHCLSAYWGCRIQHPETSAAAPSGSSDIVPAAGLPQAVEASEVPYARTGWRFHGSSGGLFADSLRGPTEAQHIAPVMCDEAKKKYWSSGLEAPSMSIPPGAVSSADRPTPCGSNERYPMSSGLMSFAYAGSLQGGELISRPASKISDAFAPQCGTTQYVTHDGVGGRWNDSASLRTESVASILAGASPYRWMRRQIKQQRVAGTPPCPQASPSFRSHVTRGSRPGIPNFPTYGNGKSNCHSDFQRHALRTYSGGQEAKAGWRGLKLLFAAQPTDGEPFVDPHAEEAEQIKDNQESRWGIRVLKRRKQRPMPAQLDDAEYDDLVLRREQRIFDWYERLVAFRYSEVNGMREAAIEKLNKSASETLPCPCSGDTAEAHPATVSSSASTPHGEEGIKWSSFDTLFPQDACVGQPQLDEVRGTSGIARPVESQMVACIHTEDLFDWPLKEEPPSRTGLLFQDKRRPKQHRCLLSPHIGTGGSLIDCPKLPNPPKAAGAGSSTDGSSTRGGSIPEHVLPPVVHYRFKDMVEMPHLREVRRTPKAYSSVGSPFSSSNAVAHR